MDEALTWIIIAVVVLVLIALAAWVLRNRGQRATERRAHEAQELRRKAEADRVELQRREAAASKADAEARLAAAEAQERSAEAARLQAEARERAAELQGPRAEVEERLRRADELDPDHRGDVPQGRTANEILDDRRRDDGGATVDPRVDDGRDRV